MRAGTRQLGDAEIPRAPELARTAKLAGNPARSREAYQEFLSRWKNADPDLPMLKQVKSEFARP